MDLKKVLERRLAPRLNHLYKVRMKRAAEFIEAKVKEVVGVQYIGGMATNGAPPRRRTGNLQDHVVARATAKTIIVSCNVTSAKGFPYGRYHEVKVPGMPMSGRHPFLRITLQRYKEQVKQILKGRVK